MHVGCGKMTLDDLAHCLYSGDRSRSPPPAPPQGLFLTSVHYPPASFQTTFISHTNADEGVDDAVDGRESGVDGDVK